MKFIITADWHLRSDKPRCRIDSDWIRTQKDAIAFVYSKATQYQANVCIVGDIFHRPNDNIYVLYMFLSAILNSLVHTGVLAGNHDLLYNSFEYVNRSQYGIIQSVMTTTDKLNPLVIWGKSYNYGQPFSAYKDAKWEIVFLHELTFKTEREAPPGSKYYLAQDLLDMFPDAKWIFTGDNHHNFVYEKNHRYVINPGCLLRQAADMKDYQPVIYYVDTVTEEIEKIPVPDDMSMVTDEYLTEEKERDERITAFVQSIKKKGKISLSFRDNLEKRMERKQVEKGAKEIIFECFKEVQYGNTRI